MTAPAVTEIATYDALRALDGEWQALWDRCPGATTFQRPAWLLPYCDHLGNGRLAALAFRSEERLVGLAPLFPWDDGPVRVLSLLGAGVSDGVDVLFEPAHAEACAAALSAHLSAAPARWDRCDLEPLRASSPLLAMPAPRACRATCVEEEACPVLPLPVGVSGLAAVVPKETLRNVRRARARVEQQGRLALVTAAGADRASILDALFALHARRWTGQGQPGVLATEAVRAFHRDASAALLAAGALRLHAVTLDGRVLAVLYGFAAHGTASFYLQGFDPEHERLSPGALVVAHAVEEAVRAGDREADFLRGRERYKYLWGAVDRPTYRLTITRPC